MFSFFYVSLSCFQFPLCVFACGCRKGGMETRILYGTLRKSSDNVPSTGFFWSLQNKKKCWLIQACEWTLQLPPTTLVTCKAFLVKQSTLWECYLNKLCTHYSFYCGGFIFIWTVSMHIKWKLPMKAYACINMHKYREDKMKGVHCTNTGWFTLMFCFCASKKKIKKYIFFSVMERLVCFVFRNGYVRGVLTKVAS